MQICNVPNFALLYKLKLTEMQSQQTNQVQHENINNGTFVDVIVNLKPINFKSARYLHIWNHFHQHDNIRAR